jgi:hypothetical protein
MRSKTSRAKKRKTGLTQKDREQARQQMPEKREREWMREWKRKRKELDVRYLGWKPRKIPPGRVLMHNHVLHGPHWPIGINGFRAWTALKPYDGYVLCPCGWAGLEHYARDDFVEAYRENPARYMRRVRAEERRGALDDG